jgi:predicted RecB family endonuclease
LESWYSQGQRGEEIGRDILKQLGFSFIFNSKFHDEDKRKPSFDILVTRWGQKYAVNIKFGNNFVFTSTNAIRLARFCKKFGFRPALLFILSKKRFYFYSLDNQVSQALDLKNEKLEVYA